MLLQTVFVSLIAMCPVDELTPAQREFLNQLVSDRVLLRTIDLHFVGDYDLPIRAEDREELRSIKQQVDHEAHAVREFLDSLPVSREIRESLIESTRTAHADQFVTRTAGLIPSEVKFRVGQIRFQGEFVQLLAEDRRSQELVGLTDSQREKIAQLARPKGLLVLIEEQIARGEPVRYVPSYQVTDAPQRDGDQRSTLTSVHIFDVLDDRQKEIVLSMFGEYQPGSWIEYVVERDERSEVERGPTRNLK